MLPIVLLDRLSVTRAGATATRVDADGLVASAAADTIREEFAPLTGARRGWLLERAATNLLLRSEDFAAGDWSKTNATVSADAGTAPDGAAAADRLVETTGTGEHGAAQGFAATSGQAYALSCWLKAGERGKAVLRLSGAAFSTAQAARFDLSTGGVTVTSGAPATQIEEFPGDWFRCAIVAAATSTDTAAAGILLVDGADAISYTGNASNGLQAWGAMLEAGDCATSYVPTTSATATRAADLVTLPLTGLIRPSEFTVLCHFMVPQIVQAAPRIAAALSNGAGTEQVRLGWSTGGANLTDGVIAGGAHQYGGAGDAGPESLAALVLMKHAIRVKANDLAGCWNGTLNDADTGATMPGGLTTLHLGSREGGNDPLNGWLQRIEIYDRGKANAWLETITA